MIKVNAGCTRKTTEIAHSSPAQSPKAGKEGNERNERHEWNPDEQGADEGKQYDRGERRDH